MSLRECKPCVPPLFLCPISLEMMRDPVTVCTGITYDRRPIQKWLAEGHTTCPTTMCHLENHILIPNLIVRRMIQSWVQENGSGSLPASAFGSPKRDTEKQRSGDCTHAEPERVLSLLREIARGGQGVRNAAKCLGALAKERVEYRTCIDELGGTLLLVSLLSPEMHEDCEACEEVLGVLVMLAQCRGGTRQMVMEPQTLACVVWHLDRGTPCARVNAAALLESLLASDELCATVGRFPGVLQGLVKLVNEGGGVQQHRASKIAVRTLLAACLCKVHNHSRTVHAQHCVSTRIEFSHYQKTSGFHMCGASRSIGHGQQMQEQ
jgi:hypothetical protein